MLFEGREVESLGTRNGAVRGAGPCTTAAEKGPAVKLSGGKRLLGTLFGREPFRDAAPTPA